MATPANANENCPGVGSEGAGAASACAGCPNQKTCAAGTAPPPDPDIAIIASRLGNVKRIILVLSGKGGVGKSTVSTQLAYGLAAAGKEVGLLDLDICGPSMPTMLDLVGEEVHQSAAGWSPVYVEDNLGVMSIGFLLPNTDDAVVWRGPRKNSLIKQFLKDVDWGVLDYLIIDTPPGTSDEHISIAQLLSGKGIDGAVIVTTPQEVAMVDVRKELSFCRKVNIPILGVVENMAGLYMPLQGVRISSYSQGGADMGAIVAQALQGAGLNLADLAIEIDVFAASRGGAGAMAAKMNLPLLGKIPLDPTLCLAGEHGKAFIRDFQNVEALGPTALALRGIIECIVKQMPSSSSC